MANKGAPSRGETFDDGHGKTATYLLNDRFNWIVTQHYISGLLPIIRAEQQVTDVQKKRSAGAICGFWGRQFSQEYSRTARTAEVLVA